MLDSVGAGLLTCDEVKVEFDSVESGLNWIRVISSLGMFELCSVLIGEGRKLCSIL